MDGDGNGIEKKKSSNLFIRHVDEKSPSMAIKKMRIEIFNAKFSFRVHVHEQFKHPHTQLQRFCY